MRAGRLRQAEDALRAGLAVEPGDARLYAALARLEALRGRWRRAVAYGEAAGGRADLATLALVGDAHAALGDRAVAEAWWRKVEEGYAANPEPYARQWTQFRLDHEIGPAETRAVLEGEIRGRPDALGWDVLAWARLRTGDVAGAREASRRALRMGTRDAAFHFHAGMIERAAGALPAARRHLRRALEINPRFHHFFADSARAALDGLAR
jgi:tetratricopeptide (TPR) repeat protein